MTKPATTNESAKTTAQNPDTDDHDCIANPDYRTPKESLTTINAPPAAPTKQRNGKLPAFRRLNF